MMEYLVLDEVREPSLHADSGFFLPSKWAERHLPQTSSSMKMSGTSFAVAVF